MGAAGDQRSDLRRQAMDRAFGFCSGPVGKRRRKSRSSSSATRLKLFFGMAEAKRDARVVDPRRGAEHWTVLAGGFRFPCAGPDGSNQKRTFGRRAGVEKSGSSSEGAVRCEATPELVSQDRERVRLGLRV
jgi:hypothetical protein